MAEQEVTAKKDSKNILDKAVAAVQNFQPDKSLFAILIHDLYQSLSLIKKSL